MVSFGGPEGPDDIEPFLANVVRGKDVPAGRLREAARRYKALGGVSPINAQHRALLAALVAELSVHGPRLPVYWGNRNWHPLLPDVVRQMAGDGVRHALALVTSVLGSYSSCRQYIEDLERARQEVGAAAPQIDKLRLFYNHPGFIEAMADRVRAAFDQIGPDRRPAAGVIFTAHSIPAAMAGHCRYEEQFREACRLVAERLGLGGWQLAYQSRSGPPGQPWLDPDVRQLVAALAAKGGVRDLVVVPLGFLCEHLEIVYDLDIELRQICEEQGLNMVRAGVAGCHPQFVGMIRQLVLERTAGNPARLALGTLGPWPDQCPADCCRPATDPPAAAPP
ncbi:MAG: ferrochelatase [Thermoguttaceae bacterium]